MKMNIIGDNAKVTTGNGSHIITNSQSKKNNFFDKWFIVISFITFSLSIGIGLYWESLPLGIIIGAVLFTVLSFFHPSRRYYRLGWAVVFYTITYLSSSSLHLEMTVENNTLINGFLNFHKEFSLIVFISLLVFTIILFLFDIYIERKDK